VKVQLHVLPVLEVVQEDPRGRPRQAIEEADWVREICHLSGYFSLLLVHVVNQQRRASLEHFCQHLIIYIVSAIKVVHESSEFLPIKLKFEGDSEPAELDFLFEE
jgi:hypothetical protein